MTVKATILSDLATMSTNATTLLNLIPHTAGNTSQMETAIIALKAEIVAEIAYVTTYYGT